MAGQKPSGRAGGKQGPVASHPTARPASSRQGSGQRNGKAAGQQGTGQQGAGQQGAASPAAKSTAQAGGSAQANGAARASSSPRANGSADRANGTGRSAATRPGAATATATAATATAAAAAEATEGGPIRRLLHAAWAPFRAMGGLPLATFFLSLYGLGASIYLTLAHYDSSVTLVCANKGIVNCQEVTTSPESMIFGVIPVAVAGLAFYVFMVGINSPWGWRLQPLPLVRWLRLGSVVAGMGFVLYLIYAELIEIRAICLWCTSVHVATFLIFALLVFHYTFTWESPAARNQS